MNLNEQHLKVAINTWKIWRIIKKFENAPLVSMLSSLFYRYRLFWYSVWIEQIIISKKLWRYRKIIDTCVTKCRKKFRLLLSSASGKISEKFYFIKWNTVIGYSLRLHKKNKKKRILNRKKWMFLLCLYLG